MSALLELRGVSHAYDSRQVLTNLSFCVAKGAVGCLLGASGCGKTTVLRCIAGFEPVTAGEILLSGEVMSRAGLTTPPEKRRIGMVFQDYALFPHLTVARNIAFGLHHMTEVERAARVAELLATVGLDQVKNRYPHELSGGQQQRVALARALAPRPDLMLLDEPFSNLDVEMRERLSLEVRDILKQQNTTAVLVTHDQHEAFNIADEIGIMAGGSIEQWDTPYKLYHEPGSRFVADFIGQGVFLPGTVLNGNRIRVEPGILQGHAAHEWPQGSVVDVLLRPDDILHDDASPLQAQVLHKAFRGAEFLYTLQLPGGGRVLSLVPSHHNHAIGEKIGIRIEIDHLVAFPRHGKN
ncbi:MAG: ABC transporter ATP-binding protein [Betaproteobacteria bacterium RIFCSPLOWO2_12_FULL_62_13]|nr:MAG: ABC transporter ATP-binding protein [Betaproteobacteria bacterium RIFCSPLOWO2_12_FULL_62_13]